MTPSYYLSPFQFVYNEQPEAQDENAPEMDLSELIHVELLVDEEPQPATVSSFAPSPPILAVPTVPTTPLALHAPTTSATSATSATPSTSTTPPPTGATHIPPTTVARPHPAFQFQEPLTTQPGLSFSVDSTPAHSPMVATPPPWPMALPPPSTRVLGKRRMPDCSSSNEPALPAGPSLVANAPAPPAKGLGKKPKLDLTVEPAASRSQPARGPKAAAAGPSTTKGQVKKSSVQSARPAKAAKKPRTTKTPGNHPPPTWVDVGKHQCPLDGCTEEFEVEKRHINEHLRAQHDMQGVKGEVVCPCRQKDGADCGRKVQSDGLGRHLLDCHVDAKPWQCPVCPDRFARKGASERHIRECHFKTADAH